MTPEQRVIEAAKRLTSMIKIPGEIGSPIWIVNSDDFRSLVESVFSLSLASVSSAGLTEEEQAWLKEAERILQYPKSLSFQDTWLRNAPRAYAIIRRLSASLADKDREAGART